MLLYRHAYGSTGYTTKSPQQNSRVKTLTYKIRWVEFPEVTISVIKNLQIPTLRIVNGYTFKKLKSSEHG